MHACMHACLPACLPAFLPATCTCRRRFNASHPSLTVAVYLFQQQLLKKTARPIPTLLHLVSNGLASASRKLIGMFGAQGVMMVLVEQLWVMGMQAWGQAKAKQE